MALVSSAAMKVLMVAEGVVKALLDQLPVPQSALACIISMHSSYFLVESSGVGA